MKRELTEEAAALVSETNDEPVFDLIHGLPGAGKSKVIAWICELFTEILRWTHGNQFVCLAFQNTMAANIGGSTIHRWAEISFEAEGGKGRSSKPRDIGVLFTRCQNMRWILIDEISMVSAELLSELQRRVCQAVRPMGTYKKRHDKSIRPFGGINTLLFGDWWQLRPVQATSLFDCPSKAKSGSAYEGLLLLWGQSRNSVQRVWELTQPMRCVDPWYCSFLTECRNGSLSLDNYFFVHGVPTDSVGSMIPGNLGPACGNAECSRLQASEWERMFRDGKAWGEMSSRECRMCKKEQLARGVVARRDDDPRFLEHPFNSSPYIHPLNYPKYYALQVRAVEWAKTHGRTVNWVVAHDYPLHRDDQASFVNACVMLVNLCAVSLRSCRAAPVQYDKKYKRGR